MNVTSAASADCAADSAASAMAAATANVLKFMVLPLTRRGSQAVAIAIACEKSVRYRRERPRWTFFEANLTIASRWRLSAQAVYPPAAFLGEQAGSSAG